MGDDADPPSMEEHIEEWEQEMIQTTLSTLSNIEATSELQRQMARPIWISTFVALEGQWRRLKFDKNIYSDDTPHVNKHFWGAGATGRHWSLTKTFIDIAQPIWISTLGMLVGYRMGIKAYRNTYSDGTAHLNKYFWCAGGLIRRLRPRVSLCPETSPQSNRWGTKYKYHLQFDTDLQLNIMDAQSNNLFCCCRQTQGHRFRYSADAIGKKNLTFYALHQL